jgi:phage-related protein
VSDLFGHLNVEPLLKGLERLVDLFDENSVTGQALRVVFESLIQPVVDAATAAIPGLIGAFIQLQIWLLKGLIAIKPYGPEILMVIEAVGYFGAALVALVGGAIAIAIASFVAFIALPRLLAEGLIWVGTKVSELSSTILETLGSLDLSTIGMALIEGLIAGITGGASGVAKAIVGVASGAIDAAKSVLGIASPSKVFAEIGAHTAEGMAGGVEGGSAGVQSALEGMVAPPPAEAAASSPSSSGAGVNLAGATFNFYGVEGAEDAEGRIGALLTRLLEGDVAQLGGAHA